MIYLLYLLQNRLRSASFLGGRYSLQLFSFIKIANYKLKLTREKETAPHLAKLQFSRVKYVRLQGRDLSPNEVFKSSEYAGILKEMAALFGPSIEFIRDLLQKQFSKLSHNGLGRVRQSLSLEQLGVKEGVFAVLVMQQRHTSTISGKVGGIVKAFVLLGLDKTVVTSVRVLWRIDLKPVDMAPRFEYQVDQDISVLALDTMFSLGCAFYQYYQDNKPFIGMLDLQDSILENLRSSIATAPFRGDLSDVKQCYLQARNTILYRTTVMYLPERSILGVSRCSQELMPMVFRRLMYKDSTADCRTVDLAMYSVEWLMSKGNPQQFAFPQKHVFGGRSLAEAHQCIRQFTSSGLESIQLNPRQSQRCSMDENRMDTGKDANEDNDKNDDKDDDEDDDKDEDEDDDEDDDKDDDEDDDKDDDKDKEEKKKVGVLGQLKLMLQYGGGGGSLKSSDGVVEVVMAPGEGNMPIQHTKFRKNPLLHQNRVRIQLQVTSQLTVEGRCSFLGEAVNAVTPPTSELDRCFNVMLDRNLQLSDIKCRASKKTALERLFSEHKARDTSRFNILEGM